MVNYFTPLERNVNPFLYISLFHIFIFFTFKAFLYFVTFVSLFYVLFIILFYVGLLELYIFYVTIKLTRERDIQKNNDRRGDN